MNQKASQDDADSLGPRRSAAARIARCGWIAACALCLPVAPAVHGAGDAPAGMPFAGGVLPVLETTLAAELTRRVATAERWEVQVTASEDELLAGQVRRGEVRGVRVRTRDGLVIAAVSLTLDNVRLEAGGDIREVERNLLIARLDENDLEKYLRERARGEARGVRVRFRDGRIVVNARTKFAGFRVPARVIGRPVVRDGTICFDADRALVAKLKVPDRYVRRLEQRLNPVVDLRDLDPSARVTWSGIEGEQLVAHAEFRLPPRQVVAEDAAR